MGQEDVMTQRRKCSAEYKREAVAMLDAPGVTVSQIASELGFGAGMLGRWRRELTVSIDFHDSCLEGYF
jgi:transposase